MSRCLWKSDSSRIELNFVLSEFSYRQSNDKYFVLISLPSTVELGTMIEMRECISFLFSVVIYIHEQATIDKLTASIACGTSSEKKHKHLCLLVFLFISHFCCCCWVSSLLLIFFERVCLCVCIGAMVLFVDLLLLYEQSCGCNRYKNSTITNNCSIVTILFSSVNKMHFHVLC